MYSKKSTALRVSYNNTFQELMCLNKQTDSTFYLLEFNTLLAGIQHVTCWNSTHYMLKRYTKHLKALGINAVDRNIHT